MATSALDHVISFVVPFSLGITYATDSLDSLVSLAGSGTSDEDLVRQFSPPSKGVRALVSLSTAKWRDRESKIHDDEIQHLPDSPIRFGVRAGTLDLKKYSQKHAGAEASMDAKTSKVLRRYELDKRQMDTWETSEEAVTIQVKTYARSIMGIAAFIVCGGMSVPFAVGSRIRGVDPFQITTFAWVLAGFLTIFAKSRYVSEWPWHDFIHGRVVCRSVKDVCDVTRVDPQMVLMYLLLEEQVTTLRTKGPYNGMFSRRSEDVSGFTIDEPTHISTMLASGFVVLKVLNEFGEHLVCLDVRKGTKGEAPWLHQTRRYLACMDLDNEADDRLLNEPEPEPEPEPALPPPFGDKHQTVKATRLAVTKERAPVDKVKKLKIARFRVNKVLGLFVGNARFG
ncbi:hypothetical protein A1O3_00379 [Capronia epimyces CBS 606.96]|uniref:Uncharacterized protein n=1 Tax=Capronia epimyces CBS 606.96 TaxID=1182542 RepID=W9ZBE3_9EURO|nr:uncharacterized protein A1O3_00379 [Capronia epimyces CBS 606.96]EXJ91829.1 hypothetical protein A1O3_00379 [Capronia epimyces CBS 606.96]